MLTEVLGGIVVELSQPLAKASHGNSWIIFHLEFSSLVLFMKQRNMQHISCIVYMFKIITLIYTYILK